VTVRSIFHININCSDLDRSIAFYERLGFHQSLRLADYAEEADASYEALGLTGFLQHKGPVVMFLGDDLRQTRLDLMQWEEPKPPAPATPVAQQVGVPRIALWTKGVEELYREMSAEGYDFLSEPKGPFDDRAIKSLVCARDPDGLLIELIEFLPRGSELYSSSSEGRER
jgi:catechol 2,3-dioxygenase-like lactoylglutathione lyase family enzyme